MKKICIVVYGGGHVNMLIPVIKKIEKLADYQLDILALTTAASVMKAHKISVLGYKDFAQLVDPAFTDKGRGLVGSDSQNSAVEYDESIAYHGINFLDLIEQHGETAAAAMYKKSGRQVFYPINFMKRVLKKLNVDLLIATNSPRSERAAIDAAGDLGIKSLCLIDLFALQATWIKAKDYASKLCVINDSVKKTFLEAGRQCSEVEVTGNPAFDSLTSVTVIEKSLKIKAERNWDKSNIVTLLYASQPEPKKHPFTDQCGDPELPRNIENSLRRFITANDRYRLVIRYHPSENIKFRPQERIIFSPREESLHSLLHAIDIVLITTSTVGLEAHLIGKPVISIDKSIFTDDVLYSRMGISTGVKELDELADKILSVSSNLPAKPKSIQPLAATDKVVNVINQLLALQHTPEKV